MKLSELAKLTDSVIEQGSAEMEIEAAAPIDSASAGDVTFLANPRYTPRVAETRAGAIIVDEKTQVEREDIAVLRAADAYVSFALALTAFHPEPELEPGVDETAVIGNGSSIADDAQIAAHVVIGKDCLIASGVRIYPNVTIYDRVKIGPGTILHSGVSIRDDTEIGANCIIHNNCTIGADGFGFARTSDKKWLKIPQVGRVVIEDDVEIGANSSVDCASVGESRIKRGTKVDNLVQIGHSCIVGEDSLICGQTGLAGSSEIGDRVILAGQVGIAGHLKIGDDVMMAAKSATSHDVADGSVLSGVPAFESREWLRSTAAFRRLGDMVKNLRQLTKRVTELENKAGKHE